VQLADRKVLLLVSQIRKSYEGTLDILLNKSFDKRAEDIQDCLVKGMSRELLRMGSVTD